MAEQEKKRISHVRRVYKKDADGKIDKDVWVDIEVADELSVTGAGDMPGRLNSVVPPGTKQVVKQGVRYKFEYAVDDDLSGKRSTENKRVHREDDETGLPIEDQYIDVDIIADIDLDGILDRLFWGTQFKFDNSPENESRWGNVRRVVHCDIDDGFLDDDGGSRGPQPPRDPEDYLAAVRASNSTDKEQWVDIEIPKVVRTKRNAGFAYQGTKFIFEPDSLLLQSLPNDDGKLTNKTTENAAGNGGIDPPYRLDPLEWIINVSWGGGLAVEFFDKAGPSEDQPNT